MNRISKEFWMTLYCNRLIERGGMTMEYARQCYLGGLESHDYNDDPIEAADEEISYWADSGVCPHD